MSTIGKVATGIAIGVIIGLLAIPVIVFTAPKVDDRYNPWDDLGAC